MSCPLRFFAEKLVLILTGLAIVHTWYIDGFPVACQVDGGSMAPALLGQHFEWTCPKCGFTFSCASRMIEDAKVECPNCASRFKPDAPSPVLAGDRVLIDRSAFQFRRPRRWEVVAFARPASGDGLIVKRVVGLPNETISLRDGRIYADGTLLRKDLRQQRAMRILVHDDDHCGPSPRWRGQDVGSNWSRQDGRLVHNESRSDEIGWLAYNHSDGRGDENPPPAVTDYVFYNRGQLQRDDDLHATPDLAMSFRIKELHGRGTVWLDANDGHDDFKVSIDPRDETYVVSKNSEKLEQGSGKLPGSLQGESLEISLIDRQFLFAYGGKTLFKADIDGASSGSGRPPDMRQPLAIGMNGLGAVLDRLRVWRGIYYTDPLAGGHRPMRPCTLGPDEYFVLGDNSPISEDSRTWTENRTVLHAALAGKPFVVVYPACLVSLGGWHIQVPDLTRIRYIR